MKTVFIPTAMRCNIEQFESIKPKLIERGFKDLDLNDFGIFNYLLNNLGGTPNRFGNAQITNISEYSREIYQEWDEEIFLRNLGDCMGS